MATSVSDEEAVEAPNGVGGEAARLLVGLADDERRACAEARAPLLLRRSLLDELLGDGDHAGLPGDHREQVRARRARVEERAHLGERGVGAPLHDGVDQAEHVGLFRAGHERLNVVRPDGASVAVERQFLDLGVHRPEVRPHHVGEHCDGPALDLSALALGAVGYPAAQLVPPEGRKLLDLHEVGAKLLDGGENGVARCNLPLQEDDVRRGGQLPQEVGEPRVIAGCAARAAPSAPLALRRAHEAAHDRQAAFG